MVPLILACLHCLQHSFFELNISLIYNILNLCLLDKYSILCFLYTIMTSSDIPVTYINTRIRRQITCGICSVIDAFYKLIEEARILFTSTPGIQLPDYMGLKTFTNISCKSVPAGNYHALISTVGRAQLGRHGRITATHQYSCTKGTQADYFCQGMQLKNVGHFGPGTSVQIPRSNQNF